METNSHLDDRDDSDRDAIDRWLGRLSHTRVVDAPGLFGHHVLETGWRLDFPDGLDEHLLYLVVSGSCSATVDTSPWTLDAGTVVWIRPRTPFTMTTPDDRRTVVYRFRLAPDEESDGNLPPAVYLPAAWEVRGIFDLLVAELIDHTLPHRGERVTGLLLVLFTTLLRGAEQPVDGSVLSPSARQSIERFVDDHITGRPSVADLAAVAGLSPDYFTRTFRKTFGIPPREWLVRRRIQHAAALLDDGDRSVAQVALACGYQDSFLFSRQFKSVMGVPPQAYRAR
ncbi:helix-turn-helix domain-containing protein [Streptomyces sp. NPDC090303]|uniref:helix-turn-helix domain-containing protein n=1 Tax=Streptomyces sp. NPDC090303 TaxID=3365960 RepID=UPI0038156930